MISKIFNEHSEAAGASGPRAAAIAIAATWLVLNAVNLAENIRRAMVLGAPEGWFLLGSRTVLPFAVLNVENVALYVFVLVVTTILPLVLFRLIVTDWSPRENWLLVLTLVVLRAVSGLIAPAYGFMTELSGDVSGFLRLAVPIMLRGVLFDVVLLTCAGLAIGLTRKRVR